MFEKEIDIAALMALGMKRALNPQDQKLLEEWLLDDPANQNLFDELMQEEGIRVKMIRFDAPDRNAVWSKIIDGLAKIPENVVLNKKISLWPRIGIAVAAAIVLVGLSLFFFNQFSSLTVQDTQYVNDIGPGKVGATLTLANGERIRLKETGNGEVAKESGVSITKRNDGQIIYEINKNGKEHPDKVNTLSTSKGETYVLTLPDKSKVWMNAASSLTYNVGLQQNGIRRVKLKGEAYFEISKDELHPFVVESNGQEVEVLGTHFNINSYEDEPSIKTTLLEGRVKVTPSDPKGTAADRALKSEILIPNQQAIYTAQGIKVKNVIADSFVDWKNGVFNFENESIQSIMRKVARWYDVDIVYDGIENDLQTFSGTVSRSANVSKVLETLNDISNLKFKIEGRKIIVAK